MGDLDRELKSWKTKGQLVPQLQAMDWFVQLIIAVQYIHSQKMLHRDLKCKNVFLTESKTVKIGELINTLPVHLKFFVQLYPSKSSDATLIDAPPTLPSLLSTHPYP